MNFSMNYERILARTFFLKIRIPHQYIKISFYFIFRVYLYQYVLSLKEYRIRFVLYNSVNHFIYLFIFQF